MTDLILPPSLAAERRREREEVIRQQREADTAKVFAGWNPCGPTLDPEWQRELERIVPRDGYHSWLLLRWNPGYPWAPVGRWTIYQMHERHAVPDVVLRHLEGPDPRTLGWWDPQREKWETTARITRTQWDLYRETGCYAETFWIVQGDRGGHKAKWSHPERSVSAMMGGPAEAPAPGSLPYAPFDGRVLGRIAQLRNAEIAAQCLAFGERRPHELEPTEKAELEQMHAMLWDWVDEQTAEAADQIASTMRKDWSTLDIPRTTESTAAAHERAREEFIHED